MQDPDKPIYIADLRGLNLPNMNFHQADLRQVNLCGSDLSGVSLSEADLSGSLFCGAKLYKLATRRPKNSDSEAEFNRLVAAAVVNFKFCQLLLTNPAQAIEAGYQKEKFDFSESERQLILSIKAKTLEEFCLQLITLLRFSDT